MSKPTIVIVDDDRSFVAALSIFLERRGYHSVGVFSGTDALARLRRNGADLGIIDVHLPDVSGIELARQLQQAGGRTLPVILISGDHRRELWQACQDAGARLFLPKPVNPEELLHAISDILQREE